MSAIESPMKMPSALIHAGQALRDRSLLAAHDGRFGVAYDDLVRFLRLSARAGDDPTAISMLVRIVITRSALTTLGVLLPRSDPSESVRDALVRELDRIDPRSELRRALMGERCFGNSAYEALPRFAEVPDEGMVIPEEEAASSWTLLISGRPVLALDRAWYLRTTGRAIDLSAAPWYESAGGWRRLDAELEDRPWYAILSPIFLVTMPRIAKEAEILRAELDLARIALAGPPPTGGHRGTIDPFSGKPYRSARNADGTTRWWSVGPDGKDDGGKDGRDDHYESGDIVWTAPE